MRLILIAVFALTGALETQSAGQTLQWTRETIDTHAVTHHDDPPGRSSSIKWQVNKVEGCQVELRETDHREADGGIVNSRGVFRLDEDKVVTWRFDLGELLPQFVMADTSVGTPHLKIFAEGDAFHTKTETVSRAVRIDGSVESTKTWSVNNNTRNLTMFFDSPGVDNKKLVHRLEGEFRAAVSQCVLRASR
jgi:hypothetical protein